MVRDLFASAEMAKIGREFDQVMAQDRKGEPFTGEESQKLLWLIEVSPSLTRLVEDDRIYPVFGQLLGPDAMWVMSDGHLFVGDTQWHSATDGTSPTLDHMKVTIYLDPLTRDTGCLRVIPGSQRPEFQQNLQALNVWSDDVHNDDPSRRAFGLRGAELPSYALEVRPGDVIFTSENLWYASFGGSPGRRLINMNIYENPTTAEQVQYVRDQARTTIAMWHPHESFLNSESPRIRGMVRRYVELGIA